MTDVKKVKISRIQFGCGDKKQETILLPHSIEIVDPEELKKNYYFQIIGDIFDELDFETIPSYYHKYGKTPNPDNTLLGYVLPFNPNDDLEYQNASPGREKFQALIHRLARFYNWQIESKNITV